MKCMCPDCTFLSTYPALPALTALPTDDATWTVDCHWLSQLVKGRAVVIERGFLTDGTSFPRAAWRVMGHPFSKDILPHALGHDALYAAELLSRADCDQWFLDSMALAGVPWCKRQAIYAAVRVGGGAVWKRHTNESIAAARKACKLVDVNQYHTLNATEDIRFI